MILFACDLDNTLIHSYKRAAKEDVCVESKEEKKLSFMTPESYEALQKIAEQVEFVPTTTRSMEQYRRIRLLRNKYPQYALVSNGGILLANNQIDEEWLRGSKKMIQDTYGEMDKGMKALEEDQHVNFEVRLVDELFVFTKTQNVFETTKNLKYILDEERVDVLNHGEKIYIVPRLLTKGVAVKRLKDRLEKKYMICAGDSEFDVSMLKAADLAIVPSEDFKERFLKTHTEVVHQTLKDKGFAQLVLETVIAHITCIK
jgi:HAD superfamily hydrolase (TIGR01484 family)